MKYEAKRVLQIGAGLGEGVLWSAEEQALFWLDIEKATFNRFDPKTGLNQVWQTPSQPGCFAFRAGGGAIVAAEGGYYDLDFSSGELKFLLPSPFDTKIFRFNDGKADRQGRFWAGTILKEFGGPELGAYFCYDNGRIVSSVPNVSVSNGTAFSPDGRTMYRAETIAKKIFALDYDPHSATASNERLFAEMPRAYGIPDGATIDSEGFYWIAAPFGKETGNVVRYSPDGRIDFHIELPISMPTMVAFGGPKLSTLYVTSGHSPRNRRPTESDGDIFMIGTDFLGLPEPVCARP